MRKINFYLVRSKEKIESAAELVEREYKKDGYINDDKKNQAPSYHFLPTSNVFLAEENGKIIATVTMIGDSGKGIPMEKIYEKEIEILRKDGRKIAEISQLAINRDFIGELKEDKRKTQSSLLVSLFRMVFFGALAGGIDTLCIAINPKHDAFYESVGFSKIGPLRYYSDVNGAPALARALFVDKKVLPIDFSGGNLLFREILKDPIDEDLFRRKTDTLICFIEA